MGAALRRLLASLAADPDRMSEFIRHPMDVLEDADLSESERQAIVSRDQSQIQLSIMEDWTGAPDPRERAGVAQDLSSTPSRRPDTATGEASWSSSEQDCGRPDTSRRKPSRGYVRLTRSSTS